MPKNILWCVNYEFLSEKDRMKVVETVNCLIVWLKIMTKIMSEVDYDFKK